MSKIYRNGPIGALMDEYERAAVELKAVLQTLSDDDYLFVFDPTAKDKDCQSIQTIMNHTVRSGYGYANYIRKHFKEDFTERKTNYDLTNAIKASTALDNMLLYTEATLSNKWKLSQTKLYKQIIHTTWGQVYDIDQLLEHAIVHILRHRRQIEKSLQNRNL